MTNPGALPNPLFEPTPDPSATAAPPVHDILGVPQNEAALLSMSTSKVRSAVTRVLADLDDEAVSDWLANAEKAPDGSAILDSAQAVHVIAAFNRAFGRRKRLVNLSDVAATAWATVEGVVSVLVAAIAARRVAASS